MSLAAATSLPEEILTKYIYADRFEEVIVQLSEAVCANALSLSLRNINVATAGTHAKV